MALFTDWQGGADEHLTDEAGSEVVDVLSKAEEGGVEVGGLIWCFQQNKFNFAASEIRSLAWEL